MHGYKLKDAAAAIVVGLSLIQNQVSQNRKEQPSITPKPNILAPEQIRTQEIKKQVR